MSKLANAYRFLAIVLGLNLLFVIGAFIGQRATDETSWWNQNADLITVIDMVHGYLFMLLLVLIAVLSRRHKWTPGFTIATMLLATVPFVSFWAERRTTAVLKRDEAAL